MQRLPVDSSDIVSMGYDPKAQVLEIEFKENRLYQYYDVDQDVYNRFTKADSYGEFFFAHITKHYRYKRIQDIVASTTETLAIVTTSPRKVGNLQRACEPYGIQIEQLDLPIDEIQSDNPQKIAQHKAKQAYKLAQRPVVVNDAYWNIIALRGFPGAYMTDVTKWLKAEDFLALMQNKTDRTICCTDTLVYYDGKKSKVFSQDIWGTIGTEPKGEGPSIDQLVMLSGKTTSMAESPGAAELTTWRDFAKWYNLQLRLKRV
ncbi:MAG TPA: non-canonical purine NTP pyrophosphatase [Candidatus Saccharimonadales bacterium]|nr:non-canonical purine NTP pyrophosphatase [Candidatus Saccharimonadales bacterium]